MVVRNPDLNQTDILWTDLARRVCNDERIFPQYQNSDV